MPTPPRPRPAGARAAGTGTGGTAGADDGLVTAAQPAPGWTLLTSHGRVLLLIARTPDLRLRDMAALARITERSAAGIVRDLEQAGFLTKVRDGRRNRYVVHDEVAFRHPAEAEHQVRELIEIFADDAGGTSPRG
ncbi:MarR family winged helix-turn-helix transcriptional regulator [Dermatophilaceae bacterium Soc4.6]